MKEIVTPSAIVLSFNTGILAIADSRSIGHTGKYLRDVLDLHVLFEPF